MTAPRHIYPVILSGGTGTRLWPLSRAGLPKQLLPLLSEHTMIQETVLRIVGLAGQTPIIICNEEHRFMIAQQMRDIDVEAELVLEPEGRNTAPAAAVGALLVEARDPEGIVLLLPADHRIADQEAFARAVQRGAEAAASGLLVTFGMKATEPNTGYGYIRAREGAPLMDGVVAVDAFVEKPDLERAKEYMNAGFFWNSGMFMFGAKAFREELIALAPDILKAAEGSVRESVRDSDFIRLGRAEFCSAPSLSVDHAVMELTKAAAVVPADLGWSDIGSWAALWQMGARDGEGNVVAGDVMIQDSKNCYARSEKGMLALVGVDDLIVVATDDAILVAAKDSSQDVKDLVNRLKDSARAEYLAHTQVYRPWGDYRTIDAGDRFQVKQITVKPGGRLSLQYHHHRAEHWVVVQGTARVTCGDKIVTLNENESTYIPVGEQHRLENPGKELLRIIEVQSGSYLGEDDIVRVDDIYGRK